MVGVCDGEYGWCPQTQLDLSSGGLCVRNEARNELELVEDVLYCEGVGSSSYTL